MQIMCIVDLFQPIYTANTQALKAIGASGWIFKLEIVKKTMELVTLLCVMRISVMAIVINMVVMAILFNFAFVYPNKKLLGYTFKEQMQDVAPGFIMGTIISASVYMLNYASLPDILKLILMVVSGGALYIAMSQLTHNKEYEYVVELIKNKIKK